MHVDAVEDRRLHEVTAVAGAGAAGEQLGALVPGDLHVLEVGGELLLAHGRAHLHALGEAVADPERRGGLREGRGEAVGDAVLDDDPAGRRAALAGEREAAHHRQPHGQVEIGVVEDDGRVLAAHLELNAREVLAWRARRSRRRWRATP